LGRAMDATLEGLAEFRLFGLQHNFPSLSAHRAGLSLFRAVAGRCRGGSRCLAALTATIAAAIATVTAIAVAVTPRTSAAGLLQLGVLLLRGHGVVLHDLALEDPNLDADDAVRGLGDAVAEVDVGAQRVQRHAALAVPFRAGDLRAAEAAGDVDTNAERAEAERRLHRALHGAAESDAALELLSDGLGDQRSVD